MEHPYPQDLYLKLWKKTKIDDSNLNQQIIDQFGYRADTNFIDEIALVTRISIQDSPNTYQHGYLLYAITCKFLEKNLIKNNYVLDMNTEKGYNALCMAKAAEDMDTKIKIFTVDTIPHMESRYWNCIQDEKGKKNLKELLSPWKGLRNKYMLFQEGKTSEVLARLKRNYQRFHIINLTSTGEILKKHLEWAADKQKGGDIIFCSSNVLPDLNEDNEYDVPLLEEFIQKYPYRYKIYYDEKNDIGYAYLRKYKGNVKPITIPKLENTIKNISNDEIEKEKE